MTSAVCYVEFESAPVHTDPFEELVSHQFERVHSIIEAFVGDHHKSILHTESVFRALDEEHRVSCQQLYEQVGRVVRMLPPSQTLPAGLSADDALCLLLKELCGYGYADIALLLSMEPQEVKVAIWRARSALLAA
ncbi:MAG: sigma-70 region 4 domain-containing protein [Candidatus Lambdaproteobacteria bacterium]|nr:sigma-70 region 4 domain-containing protein [Candidatus Lambdaproteobacteria bacterium]